MKLIGLRALIVDDIRHIRSYYRDGQIVLEDEDVGQEPEKEAGVGVKKHEDVPLAKALKAAGKTQAELAKEIGVQPPEISRYKSKVPGIARRPSFKSMVRLQKALGTITKLFPELS
jgi:hypothetical protein